MRAQPLAEEKKKKLTKDDLREGAIDVLLNAFSILREVAEDFRSSDRYFKFKALVLSVWLMLSITSVGISCSGASVGNSFGASVVISEVNNSPVYMVTNRSEASWHDVQITVNGKYYVTAAELRPSGGDGITLTPKLMFDETGKEAPPELVIREIHLGCSEGDTFLLRNGKPQ